MTTSVNSTTRKLQRNSEPCPRHPWVPVVADVLREPVLPLLVTLCLLANPKSGRVLVTKQVLTGFLEVNDETLESDLQKLGEKGHIEIESDCEYLVLSVLSWSNRRRFTDSSEASKEGKAERSALQGVSAERSSSSPAVEAAKQDNAGPEQKTGVGERGPERGEEGWRGPLLNRLLRVVNAPGERASYESFCREYPRGILEEALDRVEKTPGHRIRKSRGALFVYLVKTLSANHTP